MKGNGNSRYLKTVGEALSLYPTYEDFLQAMIEGTFPVDLNGINKDGWTQQGTPLNKANLLSDTVISTLGLPTGVNSTPNDAFNVLANIGNVHVWRKTVVTEEGIPAGYKLGATITKATIFRGATSSYYFAAKAHATISVLDDGTPVVSGSNSGGQMGTISSVIADDGEFIYLEEISSSNGGNNLLIKPWLVKSVGGRSSLQFDVNTGNIECTGSFAQVTTYPTTPPGTHVTYLTSVNRDAYQDGTDGSEKPAGYTLGDEVTGRTSLTNRNSEHDNSRWFYSDQVDVSYEGKVSLREPNEVSFDAEQSNAVNMAKYLIGKFIMTDFSNTDFSANTVYFIPNDASVLREMSGTRYVYTSSYQTVTGYSAIPAGTTIKYLGVLGEKTSIETGSYMGTGTSGSSNPTKIPISSSPKFAIISPSSLQNSNRYSAFIIWCFGSTSASSVMSDVSSSQKISVDYSDGYFSWYGSTANYQLNESGTSYVYTFLM